VICVASGKGGTGKSLVSANLGVYLARKSGAVVLFDADLGLANAHLLLGMRPRRNLSHVLRGHEELDSVLETGPGGLRLLSGGTGLSVPGSVGDAEIYQIAAQLEVLESEFDYVVVDAAAGIGPTTMALLYTASEAVVVTTSDITAMTDAYALLKTLVRHHPDSRTWLLANRTRRNEEGLEIHERICAVSRKYLGHTPRYLGAIPEDPRVAESIARRRPLLLSHPRTPAARAVLAAARRLVAASAAPEPRDRPTDRILPLYRAD
jgi:flagellar biosynthesis protein FlhG